MIHANRVPLYDIILFEIHLAETFYTRISIKRIRRIVAGDKNTNELLFYGYLHSFKRELAVGEWLKIATRNYGNGRRRAETRRSGHARSVAPRPPQVGL